MQFQGNIGILILGRKILKNEPKGALHFLVDGNQNNLTEFEITLMGEGIASILKQETRFGRIGVMLDRKNFSGIRVLESVDVEGQVYNPKEKRAEKKPIVTTFIVQAIKHLALEGLADSVEFRRLTRKYIRQVKNANCDTLFFPEFIFGEAKTKKILQHIAGTQLRVFTLDDFFDPKIEPSGKQKIIIEYEHEDPIFLKKRAEAILRMKLGQSAIKNV